MSSDLKLYSYFRSSASFRVRIALNLKRVSYDQIAVHLLRDGGEQFSAEYNAINPQSLVPTLSDTSNGAQQILSQSLAIIEYLDECYPTPPLLPDNIADRAFVRSVALQIACEIHPINNLRVLKYLETLGVGAAKKDEWYAHWISLGFSALESRLVADPRVGSFVCGDTPSVADICLVPQVWNARRFNVRLDAYPTILRVADHALCHPAFERASPSMQPDSEPPPRG
ncbi:maleylacetoacetate isomerase [Paraburkholderia phenoliruptrix]|uniref:maleylacetoacetate isomerase n=1 Tax=Paraburkholderia phenoliruptrix TaxID=252970 RepID=UPI0034CFF9E6